MGKQLQPHRGSQGGKAPRHPGLRETENRATGLGGDTKLVAAPYQNCSL